MIHKNILYVEHSRVLLHFTTCWSTSGSILRSFCWHSVGNSENVCLLISARKLVLTRMESGVSTSISHLVRLSCPEKPKRWDQLHNLMCWHKWHQSVMILTGTEPTWTLRHLSGTSRVAHICFDRGGRAGGRVLWTGRAALCLFQLPGYSKQTYGFIFLLYLHKPSKVWTHLKNMLLFLTSQSER